MTVVVAAEIAVEAIAAPLHLRSAGECVTFERDSFGVLHQMMAALTEGEKEETWREMREIAHELRQFEGPSGFVGPCELLVGVGTK